MKLYGDKFTPQSKKTMYWNSMQKLYNILKSAQKLGLPSHV